MGGLTVVVDTKDISRILLIFLSEKESKLISQGFILTGEEKELSHDPY